MPRDIYAYEGEKKDFPSILRKLMEEDHKEKYGKKDSQEALAKAIGVQRQTISGYLNGLSSPDWEKLLKIANRYEVSVDYLLGNSGDKHIEHIAVDELGLSQKAVNHIKDVKRLADMEEDKNGDFHRRLAALDSLLRSNRFSRFLSYFTLAEKAAEKTRTVYNQLEEQKRSKDSVVPVSLLDKESYAFNKFLCLREFEKMLDAFCKAEDFDK